MSGPAPDHPPPERLPAFGLGLLSAEESAAIERHVAECDACCRSLLTVADDALVSRLRQAASTSSDGPPSAAAPTQGTRAAHRMAVSPDGRHALVSLHSHPDPRLWRLPDLPPAGKP